MKQVQTRRTLLPTARYTKEQIRNKLSKLIRTRKTQLSQKLIPARGSNDESRLKAIRRLSNFLADFQNKGTDKHINLCLILEDEIITLAPGRKSKFQKLREELYDLIRWCKDHHTLSPCSRFHPQFIESI